MKVFEGQSADEVWRLAASFLLNNVKINQASQEGETWEVLHAGLSISDPRSRWVGSRFPSMNPAFALVEIIWIMAGEQKSNVPNFWNPALPKYSGRGDTFHGAYGFRLRSHFGIDQLTKAYNSLCASPDSRQVVLQIWDPSDDSPDELGKPVAEDVPCNVFSMLKVRNDKLHWTQVMRSNDIFRGFPHNIIQFTTLQEIMAGWLGIEVGNYLHIADSLHAYQGDIPEFGCRDHPPEVFQQEDLRLAKDDSERLFSNLFRRLEDTVGEGITEKKLRQIYLSDIDMPNAYLDIMSIIGADAARRLGYPELMAELEAQCNCKGLGAMFEGWKHRHSLQ